MDYIDDDLEGEAPCEFCNELYPLVLLIEHQSIHLTGGDDFSYLDDMLTHEEVAQNIIAEDLGLSTKSEVIIEKQQQSAVKNEPEVIIKQQQQSGVKIEAKGILEQKQQSAAKNEANTSDESAKTEQKRSAPNSFDEILCTEFHKRRRNNSSSSSEENNEDIDVGELNHTEIDDNNDDDISVVYETKAENVTTEQKLFTKTLKEIKEFPEQKGKEFITEKGEKLVVYGDEIDPDKEMENEKSAYTMPNNPLLSSICKNEDVEDINNLSDDDCDESLEEFWKRARDFLKKNRVRNETSC